MIRHHKNVSKQTSAYLPNKEWFNSYSYACIAGQRWDRFWDAPHEPGFENMELPELYQIGCSSWPADVEVRRDSYHLLSIELVISGNVIYSCDGISNVVNPGEVFIKRDGAAHSYRTGPAGFVHKRFFNLAGTHLARTISELKLSNIAVVELRNKNTLIRILKQAVAIMNEKPAGYSLDLCTLGMRALFEVAASNTLQSYPDAIRLVIDYMQHNLHRHLSMAELAREVGMSRAHFYRMFQQYLKTSPSVFIKELKMKRAGNLLLNTNFPVSQIAGRLGYTSPFLFSTHFKEESGMSPRQFRNSNKA